MQKVGPLKKNPKGLIYMNAITRLFIEGVITNLLDENINENKILS